jgi:hypothetical protein
MATIAVPRRAERLGTDRLDVGRLIPLGAVLLLLSLTVLPVGVMMIVGLIVVVAAVNKLSGRFGISA